MEAKPNRVEWYKMERIVENDKKQNLKVFSKG